MAEIKDYSVTADDNNSASPNGMPENQAPSTVNNSVRETLARVKRWYEDINGTKSTTGSSNAYVLAAARTVTAYAQGDAYMFRANHANTGAATLNIDSVGAVAIVNNTQSALAAGQIQAGGIYLVAYDATNSKFQLVGASATSASGDNIFVFNASPSVTLSNSTAEDSDGGRESTIQWKGLQSGSEESTLVKIIGSHDGSSDDQKGKLQIYTNDGSDGDSPTLQVTIDSAGLCTLVGAASLGSTLTVAGATQLNSTVTVGANDQGYDVILYGDTASANVTWDTSVDDLILNGAAGLIVPDGQLTLGSTAVTSTGAELNILDGVTASTAELNILDGVTSTTAEINILDGVTSTTAELNILDGVTSTTAELNILDGVTSTTAELNILDGVTATATELNYLDITTLGTTQASKAVTTDSNGDVVFPDGDKINLGAGSDLVLQHDGSDSYIQNSTGSLKLQGKSGEDGIVLAPDGAVTLYHDNASKIATHASGALMTTTSELQFYTTAYGIRASTGLEIKTGDFTRFLKGATEYMRLDTNGKLGIGTSAPAVLLNVASGADGVAARFNRTSGGGIVDIENYNAIGGIGTTDNIPFRLNTYNAERVRIANDGKVGVGTSANLTGYVNLPESDYGEGFNWFSSGTAGNRGGIGHYAYESRIYYGSSDNLTFVDGGPSGTERMRISAAGTVIINSVVDAFRIGSSSVGSVPVISESFAGNGRWLRNSNDTTTTDGARHQTFFSGGSEKGSITTASGGTTYGSSSDYRLKENVSYTFDATTRLKQLKPARFNFISNADKTVDGFLAHEVSSIVPEAVVGEKDAVNSDNDPIYQHIDQSKLVPLLVKTIQELEARITALEAG